MPSAGNTILFRGGVFDNYELAPETRRDFVQATSGPLADIKANRWSPEHAAYNDAVNKAFE
jgi:hypothetical protein